ncbi:mitochondrial protein Pet127-domain-containing protein [Crucibulum laeve]|uniref:Mitochondrial protein Pet127-domain-containing protein n=1 Tax=Crucibulum laeve TaxID=68775 RepID=A0A5C3M6W3_9AGAR|nr:mitochondrial protein Pet127-domain-containing protein [Crucibulum laeve]
MTGVLIVRIHIGYYPTDYANVGTELQPPSSTESSTISEKLPHEEKLPPPHLVRFSKRIEGLIEPNDEPTLVDVPSVDEHQPIATLTHGIDRVLFNPGVHWLQDPRSRVYNFTPWLEKIPRVSDFAFESLDGFTSSSRDKELWELARREKKSYAGSTSSLSGMLSQIYFLISGDKEVDTSTLSAAFRKEPKSFTPGQRMPSSVKLNYRDGRYAIDSYSISGSSEKNVLTWMGTLLEKFITMTREEFSTYMRTSDTPPPPKDPRREAFRFAKSKRFVMRSQLDCQDPRLPGTGVFDIKTRACVPIRMDILNFEENSGYLIKHQYGLLESFEKEYYDLIRSAFLKYSFQVRIGNMDGVIVAYHNTARMFGFQYIPLTEMEERLYGPGEGVGDRVFDKCVGMLENVMDEIVKCFPEQTVQCTFETQERSRKLNIWVEPEQWEGAAEDRPIKQLEVTVTNYLGQEPVTGNEAVSSTTKPWTIHYTITHLIDDEFAVRKRLLGCQERQFRAYAIPAGVALDDLPKFWDTLNFGPPSTEESKESDFDPKFFREPSASINKMRALAQQGRKETLRLYELDSKKPKIVFGGEDIPPEAPLVQEVSLEASRDVEDNVGTFLGAVGDSIALSKIGHDRHSDMFNAGSASWSEELSTAVDANAGSAPGVPLQRSSNKESNVATAEEDTLSSGGKSASLS